MMIQKPPPIALKLSSEMTRLNTSIMEIATLFEVKVPSVHDWLNFGRIAKKHLPKLAQWSGREIGWWVDDTIPIVNHVAQPHNLYKEKSGHGGIKKTASKKELCAWPFSVSYQIYDALAIKDKKTLDRIIIAFVSGKS